MALIGILVMNHVFSNDPHGSTSLENKTKPNWLLNFLNFLAEEYKSKYSISGSEGDSDK